MQYAQLLSPGEAEQVHEASQELLESLGILVHNAKARRIFERHGCRVDARTGIVKIPRRIVEKYRQAFVPTFTFRGRDPRFEKTIPDDSPVIVTASSAPDIVDPVTGALRRATSTDIANIYAALSTVTDMRTGSYAPGAIETCILQMAHSQMAHFYNVPSGGYIGLTGAHGNDAQAGYETGMNITAAMLGRTHMFNTGGLLSSLMAFDFAKAAESIWFTETQDLFRI